MKIGICLKLALFSFLCAIVCTIGYILTDLELIAIAVNWLWLATYCFLIAWVCKKVYKRIRCSRNLIVVIASFAMALYAGIQVSVQGSFGYAGETGSFSIFSVLFLASTVICLISVMVVIGRVIFGNPQNQKPAEKSVPENTWTCECGSVNTGRFCSSCGTQKPTEETQENGV